MNNVNLIGRTTKDPELRRTEGGKSLCYFDLAVKGNKTQDYFIPCIAWEKTAELITQYIKKGEQLGVSGRLTSRNYQANDGTNRTAYQVAVDNITFISAPKTTKANADPMDDFEEAKDDDLPF